MSPTFENMSHEQMLKWLDEARSGEIQGAADRLLDAASEIRRIAEDLKVRPQWVEWKGQGADAFRTWSADLANATLRLGDYSEGVSKWLGEASNAIASAQASIPRPEAGARANLEAALAARNDPDASDVARKSAAELIETGRRNREEAAAQMRKLSQTYAMSSSQLASLEKPVFPAVPGVIMPETARRRAESEEQVYRRGAATGRREGGIAQPVHSPDAATGAAIRPGGAEAPLPVAGAVRKPVGVDLDSVEVSQKMPTSPRTDPPGMPGTGGAERATSPVLGGVPPVIGATPVSQPMANGGGRVHGGTGQSASPSTGNGSAVGSPTRRTEGIVGGRPTPQVSGRPAVGLPHGAVVGGEGNRIAPTPMGRGIGMGGVGSSGQNGLAGGRRPESGTGSGVVGGRPQQPGRTSSHPFTPGGTGLVRGSGDAGGGRQTVRPAAFAPQHRDTSRRGEERERPRYLTEDEETWYQNGKRAVPPVIE
ncbi:WXG100 family type VII secretion target [Streptomyces sp. NPDC002431]